MRIVLQDTRTGLYYGRGGGWVGNAAEAYAFQDQVRARDYCVYRQLTQAKVVVWSEVTEPAVAPQVDAAPVEFETGSGSMKAKVPRKTTAPAATPRAAKKRSASPAGSVAGEGKTSAKKPAAKKAVTSSPETAVPSLVAEGPLTTVEVKLDVGFGNALFIRGEGDSLSWDEGIPLRCVDSANWVWSTTGAKDRLVFKILLNDQVWSQGDNFVAPAGQKTEVAPVF